jgi:LPXTG-motif cell wall-anchored protein
VWAAGVREGSHQLGGWKPRESRGRHETGRQIFTLLLVVIPTISIGLGAPGAAARPVSTKALSSPTADVDHLLAQVPEPTPTPSLSPTPVLPDEIENPENEANDRGQAATDQVTGTVPGIQDEANGARGAANQESERAADQADEAAGEIGGAAGRVAEGAPNSAAGVQGGTQIQSGANSAAGVQGGTDIQSGTWTEASNANPSTDSDLVTVVAAGNDVLGEPPAEAGERDPAIGDLPAPWWLPITGSQWLRLGAIAAVILIVLGGGLVALRRRRRHGTAGWAR